MRRTGAWRTLFTLMARRSGGDVLGFGGLLAALPRMLRHGAKGRYPGLDWRQVALGGVGLLYVLSPIDFIPELPFGVFGLGDDAVVLGWSLGALLGEAERFVAWERGLTAAPDDAPGAPGAAGPTDPGGAPGPGPGPGRPTVVPGEVISTPREP